MSEFKKGDRVQLIKKGKQHALGDIPLGAILVIEENNSIYPYISYKEARGDESCDEFVLDLDKDCDEVELLSDVDTERKPDGKKEGLRFNEGKLAVDQIPPDIIKALAQVYTEGSKKYPKHNWTLGMDWSICIGCAERHFLAWKMGESIDEETGCHHLALAIWNLAALFIYEIYKKGTDDRFFQVVKDPSKFIKDKK